MPGRGISYRNATAEDSALAATMAKLLAHVNVRTAASAGRLVPALTATSVTPDVTEPTANEVVPVHRRTASGDQWVLYNNSTKPVSTTFRFAAKGIPTLIDPWTGQVTKLGNYRTTKGVTHVPMTIGASDTAIVTFDRSARNRHVD
ncbi:glycosyl hydrolase [Streptomyces sp. GTA36]